MNESGVRLIDLFPHGLARIGEAVQTRVADHTSRTAGGAIAWDMLKSEATARLGEALNIDVLEFIARAWSAARELKEYTDPQKHPPEETAIVHLGQHEVTSRSQPVIEIEIGEVRLPPLRFTLDLTARFKSVALAIRAGTIRAVAPGECSAKVELKYGNTTLLGPEETPTVRFPGRIDLGKGIRIA